MKSIKLLGIEALAVVFITAIFGFRAEPLTPAILSQEKVYSMADVDLMATWSDCAEEKNNEMRIQCLFTGLSKHVIENLKYPQLALDEGLTAKLMVRIVISEKGEVERAVVHKELADDVASKSLEKEAIRVLLSSPAMIPAELDGQKVKTQLIVPVRFELN